MRQLLSASEVILAANGSRADGRRACTSVGSAALVSSGTELFPIVVACALWYPEFSGKRLQFWCDNESVVAIINQGHSKAPRIMDLVSLSLFLWNTTFSFGRAMLQAWITALLTLSPAFRRLHFRELAPHAEPHPFTIPPSLMTLWGPRSLVMRTGPYPVIPGVLTVPGRSVSCHFASWTAFSTPRGTFSLLRRAHLFTLPPTWLGPLNTVPLSFILVRSATFTYYQATATPCRANCCSKRFCAASFVSKGNTEPSASLLLPRFYWVSVPSSTAGFATGISPWFGPPLRWLLSLSCVAANLVPRVSLWGGLGRGAWAPCGLTRIEGHGARMESYIDDAAIRANWIINRCRTAPPLDWRYWSSHM